MSVLESKNLNEESNIIIMYKFSSFIYPEMI